MRIERSSFLKAVVLLRCARERGNVGACATAGATPAVLTPESLSIPEQPPSPPPSSALLNYRAVTAERLKQPADGEWLMVRRTYDGWGYSPLDQINTKNVSRLQPVWTHVHRHEQRTRGRAARQRRCDVRVDVVQPGAGARREVGRRVVALSQRRTHQREGQAGEPRRRAVRRQSVRAAGRSRSGCARRQNGKGSVADGDRGQHNRRVSDGAAARGRRQTGRRHCGRRRRESRIRCCLRSRHRPAVMENLHDAGARRAGKRDVAGRRLANRRRGHVGDWQLRS